MKWILILLALSGCAQKWDRYKDAAYMAGNPDTVHIEYHRQDNDASFYEYRCAGDLCPVGTTERP